jgi:hypothetical protein
VLATLLIRAKKGHWGHLIRVCVADGQSSQHKGGEFYQSFSELFLRLFGLILLKNTPLYFRAT